MEMKSKIGNYDFLVEPFHCDFSHRMFLGHLGNSLLNAADFHSNDRGFGMNCLNPLHRTWVLSRLVMEMERMPEAYDTITVSTWVENVKRYFTSRNYVVRDSGGRLCGYGRSIWAMIDTVTRQPVDIMAVRDGLIAGYVDDVTPCPIEPPSRVKMDDGAAPVRTIEARYSDVDVNGHFNSVKYIEHILDLWDIEWYRCNDIRRIDIAYVAEAYMGDRLNIYLEQTGESEYCVRVTRLSGDAEKESETCRCKIKFVKK